MSPTTPMLDIGRPLVGRADLDARYVDLHAEDDLRLWLEDLGSAKPRTCVVFGQVGIGKTTLLHWCQQQTGRRVDVTVNLITEPWSPTMGVIWLVTALQLSRVQGPLASLLDATDCPLSPSDAPLERLRSVVAGQVGELPLAEERAGLTMWADSRELELGIACEQALELLSKKLGRVPLVAVQGLDVLSLRSAWYHGIRPVLERITDWPAHCLIEASWSLGRASTEPWHRPSDERILICAPGGSSTAMEELLAARVGVQAPALEPVLSDLAQASGGLPRQGLRLLLEYFNGRNRLRLDRDGALARARSRVRDALLATHEPPAPPDRLEAVRRDGAIGPGEDADEAILRTWVVVVEEDRTDTLVPARVNPLLVDLLDGDAAPPSPPEARWWPEVARIQGMSPVGVEPGEALTGDPQRLHQALQDLGLWERESTVLDLLDDLAEVLQAPRGLSIPLVLYRDDDAVTLAIDAVLGLHGAGGDPIPEHVDAGTVVDLELALRQRHPAGLSLCLRPGTGDDARSMVELLERQRSSLLDQGRVLLWLSQSWLPVMLRHGPHLRPFLTVYDLERDLATELSSEDIRREIRELEDIAQDNDAAQIWRQARDRLVRVLHVLAEVQK